LGFNFKKYNKIIKTNSWNIKPQKY